MGNAIKDALDVVQLLVAALVGEVTGHHHSIDIGRIDLGHRLTQFALVGVAGSHMHVTQDCQLDHPTLHGQRQGQHEE